MERKIQLQNYEKKSQAIANKFRALAQKEPAALETNIKLSWSNWGFGQEKLEVTLKRLRRYKVEYIELHGNKYGADMGYRAGEVKSLLADNNIKVSGICGMFGRECDLSSNSGIARQTAIDYIKRNVEFGQKLGAKYFLIVPGAVGRPVPYDSFEFDRSVETLRIAAGCFKDSGIQGAVEPIRSAEVSFCSTFADAERYIKAVDSPYIQKINGDVYHMWTEEKHIGETLVKYGSRLINLHLADSNRCALGEGMMDADTLIRALYLIGYNRGECFVSPEPLGPGGDPYPAMHGKPDRTKLDLLVKDTVNYFRQREQEVIGQARGISI